jgi:hypothetical protein
MSHYPSFATSMNALNLNYINDKAIEFFFVVPSDWGSSYYKEIPSNQISKIYISSPIYI